ncbi:hypothetical protein [Shewanella saliphila]|uniref:Uncharacterized protein n=1 Tax=Shewanella saliphila TaxID=2282698 RepID=A0ABQ2QBC3_9GAMM|nr:hypothetical protein [Shewanella saliphila]MCL1103376.1 hypothetical protein [Shewanella saliphila]GGP69184.1 hypothetical protein GCM10009409_37540 [Shewanella saliphila]
MTTTILTVLFSSFLLPTLLLIFTLKSRYKEHATIINQHYRNAFLLNSHPLNTAINPLDNSGRIAICLKLTTWLSLFSGSDLSLRVQHLKECLETDKNIRIKIDNIGITNISMRCNDDEIQELFNNHLSNTLRFFFNIKLLTASSPESRKLLRTYKDDPSIYLDRDNGYYKDYLTISYR